MYIYISHSTPPQQQQQQQNIITKIHTSSLLHYPSRQFLCSENIKRFLNSCKSEFQMSEAELANEDDIYNMTNFDMVMIQIDYLYIYIKICAYTIEKRKEK